MQDFEIYSLHFGASSFFIAVTVIFFTFANLLRHIIRTKFFFFLTK